jgi:ABC-type lipoprotein release transport system permease subunit
MTTLTLKMLFWKKGTTYSTIALALLVAILASTASIVNDLTSKTENLAKTRDVGQTFLLISKNSTSTINSKISLELTNLLNNRSNIKLVLPQKIFQATVKTSSKNYTVIIRGVNVQTFLESRHAYLNGSYANGTQANIGEILARLVSISKGDEISLIVNHNIVKVTIAGTVKTFTQADTEIIVPMSIANLLDEDNNTVSIIEFTTTENDQNEISQLNQLLPANVKTVKVQQTKAFIQDINRQTLSFLNLWSLAVYATVIVASYVIATRLTTESTYELAMIKALGAKRIIIFKSIIIVVLAITLLGFTLGLAIGISGAQILATFLRWTSKGIEVTPFLNMTQTAHIALFTEASSILGCIYPAIKAMHRNYAELSL